MNHDFLRHLGARLCVLVFCSLIASCSREQAPVAAPAVATAPASDPASTPATTAQVDGARIVNADAEPGNWLSNGRTYSEQRYSPLNEINESTVGDLGLAWYLDLDTSRVPPPPPPLDDTASFFVPDGFTENWYAVSWSW